jgi:triacylglycerol lipase
MRRNPVLLVHGIYDTERVFRRMSVWLGSRGYEVHTLNLIPNNGASGLDCLAAQIATYIEARVALNQRIDMVGFSMGGLVARFYLQRLGGLNRVERFISIASPHHGTWMAFLKTNPGTRQMRPGSEFLKDLNCDAASLDGIHVASIRTPFDLMILPGSSCRLGSERSIMVSVAMHRLMVRDGCVLKLIDQLLTEPAEPAATTERTSVRQEPPH